MKVNELLGNRLLLEEVALQKVSNLEDLIDPKTDEYYTGVVNVTGNADINGMGLQHKNKFIKIPVQFGTVGGSFWCTHHRLKNLEGAPKKVGEGFYCGGNDLTSLEGAPKEVGTSFNCMNNHMMTSLEGIHKLIHKAESFSCENNPIERGGIGLLLIEGLKRIYGTGGIAGKNSQAFRIIGKYLGQGKKGLLLCQEELIEAGFEEYAEL